MILCLLQYVWWIKNLYGKMVNSALFEKNTEIFPKDQLPWKVAKTIFRLHFDFFFQKSQNRGFEKQFLFFCFCGIFLKWGPDVHTWLKSDIITSYVALIWPASRDVGLFWMLMVRFYIGCCCVCLFWVVVIVSVIGCLNWRYYYWTVLG